MKNEIGDLLSGLPPFTKIAQRLGATILFCPPDRSLESFAQNYVQSKSNAILLRSGFDYPEVKKNLAYLAHKVVDYFGHFDECWCAAGSGTLIRGLQSNQHQPALAKRYFAVCVFQECPPIDKAKGVIPFLPFPEPVEDNEKPPFPSALRYDAKVWKYIRNRPGKILF